MDVRVILAATLCLATMLFSHSHATALVANGILQNYSLVADLLKSYPRVVAVDGGLIHCDAMGIVPDIILGDFDSVPSSLLQKYAHISQVSFPCDKDDTDLEIAIKQELQQGRGPLVVFGATEGRSDHMLYNLHLLARYPETLIFETAQETLFAFCKKIVIPTFPGQLLSLLPIGEPAYSVTTKGLRWELNGADLTSHFMSISNVCLSESVEIDLKKGCLLCSFERRKAKG